MLTGYYVQPPGMATHVCHGKVLYIVADLPAKAAIRYCSQFNGEHGCTDCEIKGKSVSTGNGHATVFGNQDQKPPLCSHASVSLNAATALQTKQVFWLVLHAWSNSVAWPYSQIIKGVEGICPLFWLKDFDVIHQVPIDYMYCILLGVAKRLIKLWFDSKHSLKVIYWQPSCWSWQDTIIKKTTNRHNSTSWTCTKT